MRRTFFPLLLTLVSSGAAAETLVGLRAIDLHLISFDSATPGTLTGDLTLSGFPTGAVPVAIDYRPATQTLFAVARGPSKTTCQLFAVNLESGEVTAQRGSFNCPTDFHDVDFNPSSDRLRFLSVSENFKVDPSNGVKDPDEAPAYAAGDINDGEIPELGGVAYDQNTASNPTTTLFAIDAGTDVLVRVGSINGDPDSPDTGELTTIGSLNIDAPEATGFDVSGESPGVAYLFAFTPGQAGVNGNLYTLDLTSGDTTLVGAVGAGGTDLLGVTAAQGVELGEEEDDIIFGGALAPWLLAGLLALRRRRR